jgi:hypothetical protein
MERIAIRGKFLPFVSRRAGQEQPEGNNDSRGNTTRKTEWNEDQFAANSSPPFLLTEHV